MIIKYETNEVESNEIEESKMLVYEKIQQAMNQDDKLFSHIVVDNKEIYNNIEDYIDNNLDSISEIEIVTLNIKEYSLQVLKSLEDYLDNAIPIVRNMVDEAYAGTSEIKFSSVLDLGEGIQWMNQLEDNLISLKTDLINLESFNNEVNQLNYALKEIVPAMERNDQILLADILSFEVIASLEKLQNVIKTAINKEGMN